MPDTARVKQPGQSEIGLFNLIRIDTKDAAYSARSQIPNDRIAERARPDYDYFQYSDFFFHFFRRIAFMMTMKACSDLGE